jgi:hypothetical protein
LAPEFLPQVQGEPTAVTHYPTPGLRLLVAAPDGPWRQLYRASNGDLYGVAAAVVYYVAPGWVLTAVGTIAAGPNHVSMADNGTLLVLVDGTANGYTVDLTTRAFAAIDATVETGFYGSQRIDYQDTFFIASNPGTPLFYVSGSEAATFDPLDFASKTGFPDSVQAVVSVHRNLWVLGTQTSEVWFNSGGGGSGSLTNNTFPFEIVQGGFVDRGCAAVFSVAKTDNSLFWLGQDSAGRAMVLHGVGYAATRISTHAIEVALSAYPTLSDAIGYCYQQQGHTYYVLTFPSGDATWVYDIATNLWHERCWMDGDGVEHRHRSACHAFAYETNVVGDWQNGNLYALDPAVYMDNGQRIKRVRSFPHMLNADFNRVIYRTFEADMAVGLDTSGTEDPQAVLRWSDDRGVTWSNGLSQTMGRRGAYLTLMQWNRLGLARDRVFSLEWDAPVETALNGAYVDVTDGAS